MPLLGCVSREVGSLVMSPVRSLLRMIVPLLVVACVLALGATTTVNVAAKRWFVHDVSLRARLAASGAHGVLAAGIRAGD